MGSHHGDEQMDEEQLLALKKDLLGGEGETKEELEAKLQEKFKDLDELHSKLGATGKYPAGKLNAKDAGEIRFSIGTSMDRKRVVMNFGKTVRWVAMERNQAIDVGKALIKSANETIK